MFKCNRTNTPVVLSVLDGYTFYNPELDEDLFLHEVYLDVSDAAKSEALDLSTSGLVPDNFSCNRDLTVAVQSGKPVRELMQVLGDNRELEYCEAVLVAYAYNSESY